MNDQQHSYTVLQNEISQWEHAINSQTTDSPDPLELHFRYICWLESHQKTHQGIDERFRKAVEACLTIFDKHDNYKQDLRFVKLWIKYVSNLCRFASSSSRRRRALTTREHLHNYVTHANFFSFLSLVLSQIDFQPNPLNLYKILYQKGVGTKCAAFYNGWAHYYNSSNQFKQAESIYNMGIQLKAEPIAELENAQKNFRFSVAQRMLYNDESSKKRTISSLAEQREQITSLSPHQQNSAKRTKLDEYAASGYGQQPYHNQTYPCTSNEMPQSGYVQGYNYQQQPIQEIKYTFEHGFQSPSNFYNYAQNSHEPWEAPLTLDEPFEPNQRVYYPKSRVYPGNRQEYSLEELKAHKWRYMAEEKKKREQEAEQLRVKQEQERLRQEAEAKRLLEEQERIRKEQEKKQQQLQQQQQNYQQYHHSPHHQQSWNQSANYQLPAATSYQHSPMQQHNVAHPSQQPTYQNSPQYSYAHDHMYQSQRQYADNSYHNSPQQTYQNSPSYHQPAPVKVPYDNTQAYNHQNYNYQGYQSSPLIHQNYQQSPQQSYVGSPHTQSSYSNSPQIHSVQNHHHSMQSQHSYQSPQMSQNYGNQANQNHYYSTNHYPAQYQNYNQGYGNTQHQQHAMYDSMPCQQNYNSQNNDGYQVEYLISDQNEIDPNMLQQPIVENTHNQVQPAASSLEPIVQSYMLDDLEDQIEASTIRFSSDGKSRDKKLTIKFRKEKSTNSTKIVNSDQSSCEVKDPLELSSASSSASSKRKSVKNRVNNDILDDNTQFMPSATNSSSSLANPSEYDSFSDKLSFNGCVTPGRKPTSKLSTPVSTFKSLRKAESVRSQNDDSICSFNGDQNSFFQAENDEEFRGKRLETALATIGEHLKREKLDPFNAELCRSFLVKLNFPNRDCKDYKISNSNLPKITKNQTQNFAGVSYQIEKEVGRGAFGAVFRGINTMDGNVVALKYQKPPNSWELYICTEVRKRLKNPDILPGFMTISGAVLAPNASILISEFSQYGSLLDINNKVRQATTKVMHESLVMHFTSQILNIVHYLHSCKIIHADIKPDNFLLMTL